MMTLAAYTRPLVVVKPGALGDTLLLAPVLRALAEAAPRRSVSVVGTLPNVELLKILGAAPRVLSYDRLRLFGPSQGRDPLFAGAAVVAFLGNAPEPPERDPFRVRGAHMAVWRPSRAPQGGLHMTEYLHQVLGEVTSAIAPLTLQAFAAPLAGTPFGTTPYAVLAPGAGGSAKRAPMEHFLACAATFEGRGIRPVFLVGEVELESGLDRVLPKVWTLWRRPSLEELAAGLAGAVCLVANDSGPAHLAGLLGVDTRVFFGPTDPARWRPWGARVRILPFDAPVDQAAGA
jgi:ADP-heptose:LPS heptosyltransferase